MSGQIDDKNATPHLPNSRAEGGGAGLDGKEYMRMMNDIEKFTKMKFAAPDYLVGNEAAALPRLAAKLNAGQMVPLRVGPPGAGMGHFVIAMHTRTKGFFRKTKEIQIYDPWQGTSIWVTEKDIIKHTLNIAGHTAITHAWFQTA